MLKITKRLSEDGKVPSPNVWKHLGEKHEDASLSDTCISFLANMAGCFKRIVMYQNVVEIRESELHVVEEIGEKVFCNILKNAPWIDKVKIDADLIAPMRTGIGFTEENYNRDQLKSLDVKSTVNWTQSLNNLVNANRATIRIFKYKELKCVMYNLRVFEYNGNKVPHFDKWVDCPQLRKLVVPPNTPFRLWQINTVEKTILPQKNSAVYVLARSNTLRDEAILYTLWGLKKNGFPKDVIRLIMPLVVAFGRHCWRDTAYNELLAPIEGCLISRHPPEMWSRKTDEVKRTKRAFEEKDADFQKEQARLAILQNTVGSLKEKLEQLKKEQATLLDEEIVRLTKKQKTIVKE